MKIDDKLEELERQSMEQSIAAMSSRESSKS